MARAGTKPVVPLPVAPKPGSNSHLPVQVSAHSSTLTQSVGTTNQHSQPTSPSSSLYSYNPPVNQLPAGWEQRQTNDGRIYYVHHPSRTTHWSLPADVATPAVSSLYKF